MKESLIYVLMLLVVINCILAGFMIYRITDVNEAISEIENDMRFDYTYSESSSTQTNEDLWIEIWIDKDYNVHRIGLDRDVDSLIFEMLYNGELILTKNALNETVYPTGAMPGTYTFYLTSDVNGERKVVSNVESYHID